MSIESINLWHSRARPNPTSRDFDISLGVHLEEIHEMFEGVSVHESDFPAGTDQSIALWQALRILADGLKDGTLTARIHDRRLLADSMGDQIVTAVGVTQAARMNGPEIVRRVDRSNWSKFDDEGRPIFNEHGKIAKGPNYKPVDLTGCYELKVEHVPADDTEGGGL